MVSRASIIGLIALSGCVLPYANSTPQPAVTNGKGKHAFGFRTQVPTANLLAAGDREGEFSDLPLTPFPILSIEYSYGLGDALDVEAGLDSTRFFFVLPVPTGLWGGLRLNIVNGKKFAASIAGRLGGIFGLSDDESEENTGGVFSQFTLTGQMNPYGAIRPGLSVAATPAVVFSGGRSFFAQVYSSTLSVSFTNDSIEVSPFVDGALIDAQNSSGAEFVFSGGVYFRLRPGKKRQSLTPD